MRRIVEMGITNEMIIEFDSIPTNEAFARVTVGAFFTQLNPTLEEICDIKTAVSEAVTNAIIHGYNEEIHKVRIRCRLDKVAKSIEIEIEDKGCGIADIEKAMEPLYTTKSELERSGMGFSFMEAFTDHIEVVSEVGKGTCIKMKKTVKREGEIEEEWTKQLL